MTRAHRPDERMVQSQPLSLIGPKRILGRRMRTTKERSTREANIEASLLTRPPHGDGPKPGACLPYGRCRRCRQYIVNRRRASVIGCGRFHDLPRKPDRVRGLRFGHSESWLPIKQSNMSSATPPWTKIGRLDGFLSLDEEHASICALL
jgi:hypothetical protein